MRWVLIGRLWLRRAWVGQPNAISEGCVSGFLSGRLHCRTHPTWCITYVYNDQSRKTCKMCLVFLAELLSQFNMTNKPRSSQNDERKSPWAPPGSRKSPYSDRKSPHADSTGSQKSPRTDDLGRRQVQPKGHKLEFVLNWGDELPHFSNGNFFCSVQDESQFVSGVDIP